MHDLPCPCCGFLTFEEAYGSYSICPVCDWEDDGLQLANPVAAGGANHRSLAQAQAVALSKLPEHIELARGYRRGRSWRPLLPQEIAMAQLQTQTGLRSEVLDEADAYWMDSKGM
ncbi:CPCC family cysteine-rich protein [Chitinolyticbacter albus]|uniref:CPCC family cysteine-rich protein n=1 Tax=Chitinolyticbacter albus TaxID=2961951 RepID=UPI00210ACC10|nr:CPCC family cysteine-rich protein [Chitinolyticbacter albus]